MNEKTKNGIIIVLMCIICVLIFALAFILGMKFADKEENLNNNAKNEVEQEDVHNNKENSIEFVGDKNTEVTYNPSYQTSYNHNYKINENGKVVFTDIKNEDNSLVYNSIDGVSKYISMAIPTGKQQPYYYIIVITEDGNIYYKDVFAWAQMNEQEKNMSSMNDNFVKLEYNNIKFNGLTLRRNDGFEKVVISDESGNEYYVKNDNNGLGLLKI